MNKPYGTWTKGPSPKEVYKAFGDTYVGYVPVAGRILTWLRSTEFGSNVSSDGTLRTFKYGDFREFPCVTRLDGMFKGTTYLGYISEPQSVYTRVRNSFLYAIDDQPRWQMFFLDTLTHYPRNAGISSFYLFEDFAINDDHDILQWAKYARKTTWRPLESLKDLPTRG